MNANAQRKELITALQAQASDMLGKAMLADQLSNDPASVLGNQFRKMAAKCHEAIREMQSVIGPEAL